MTPSALIALLKHEQFHDYEDVTSESYPRGWNDRSRSLIRKLQEQAVSNGLAELQAQTEGQT